MKGLRAVNTAISFATSHPAVVIGVGIGLVLTFIVHVIIRIERIAVRAFVAVGMAAAGGGAANGVGQFAQNLVQHLH
jgi:hypothetical protein